MSTPRRALLLALAPALALALALSLTACAPGAAVEAGEPWQQYATPEQAGFSSATLAEARAIAEEIGSAAVMAVYRGHALFAWGDVERRFKCHSVRKSFLSALYGIHVAEGTIDPEATLAELGIDDLDPLTETEKRARIVDLLRARSGIYHPAAYAPSDMDANMPEHESYAPGENWYYNNWDFNTLGEIFNRQTGTDLYEEFARRIAIPTGMVDYRPSDGLYVLEPSRSLHRAYTFRMSTRDMARFGQLFLQEGRWDGEQVIPADWVRESTALHSTFERGHGYGYMWWVDPAGTQPDERGLETLDAYDKYMARGSGGQGIMVIPALELVVVHRGDTDNNRGVGGGDIWQLINRVVEARVEEPADEPELIDLAPVPFDDALAAPVEKTEIAIDPERLDDYTGRYEFAPGLIVEVAAYDEYEGRLFVTVPGQGEAEIFAESDMDFFLKVTGLVTLEFVEEGGEITGLIIMAPDGVNEGRKLFE